VLMRSCPPRIKIQAEFSVGSGAMRAEMAAVGLGRRLFWSSCFSARSDVRRLTLPPCASTKGLLGASVHESRAPIPFEVDESLRCDLDPFHGKGIDEIMWHGESRSRFIPARVNLERNDSLGDWEDPVSMQRWALRSPPTVVPVVEVRWPTRQGIRYYLEERQSPESQMGHSDCTKQLLSKA